MCPKKGVLKKRRSDPDLVASSRFALASQEKAIACIKRPCMVAKISRYAHRIGHLLSNFRCICSCTGSVVIMWFSVSPVVVCVCVCFRVGAVSRSGAGCGFPITKIVCCGRRRVKKSGGRANLTCSSNDRVLCHWMVSSPFPMGPPTTWTFGYVMVYKHYQW